MPEVRIGMLTDENTKELDTRFGFGKAEIFNESSSGRKSFAVFLYF